MNQQLSFNFIENTVDVPVEVPAYPFEDLFIDTDGITEMHSNNSMAVLGDSLEVLRKIKSNSVKLIFADAPYNIGKDFGNNQDKWETVDEYINWCKEWIDECMRILTDDGSMYFMTATQHMPYLDIYTTQKYNVLCRIVWTYDSSGVQSKKMYGSLYEPILMINKSAKAKYTFNHQNIMVEAKTGATRKLIIAKTHRNHTMQRKYLGMFGVLVEFVSRWRNMKITQHKNQRHY